MKTKLTDEEVREIYRSNKPQRVLAEMFGTCQSNISQIKTGDRRERALKAIATWAGCDEHSKETRSKAMADIERKAMDALEANDQVKS